MRGWRAGLAGLGGLALLAALLVTWLHRTDRTPPEQPAPAPVEAPGAAPGAGPGEDRVARLQEELKDARARNRELAAQVAWLQGQVALLGSAAEADADTVDSDGPDDGEDERVALEEEARRPKDRWFDDQALLSRGLPENEVARLRERFSENAMERIELQNQAEREGWLSKRRYWNAAVSLELGLRQELGDEDYDLMLYATGQKNRAVIRDVLPNSPGESFGFQPGDVVLTYGGERIFRPRELRHATASGEPGEWVIVEVLRDGAIERLRAQRGPIGARLRPARVLPEALW